MREIMSKVGELYKIDSLEPARYFQFVAIDKTQLNSDAIAVFEYQGNIPIDTKGNANLELLAHSNVDFYTHTTVKAGEEKNLWAKIGEASLVNYSDALFKRVALKDDDLFLESHEVSSYKNWFIWKINEEGKNVTDIKKYSKSWRGEIFPPEDIIYRIKKGIYNGTPYYGEVV